MKKEPEMNRSMLNALTLLLFTWMNVQPASTATITWTGLGDNTSWHTPSNWDLNRQPMDGDDVVIPPVAGTLSVTYSGGTVNLNSLNSHEHIRLTGGTLNLNAASQINETFTQSGGILGGTGTLTLGFLVWTGGAMQGTGTTNALGGILFANTGANSLQLNDDRTLNNAGTADWNGTGLIINSNTATFNNLNGATFNIRTNSAWLNGTFNNSGTVNKLGPPSETTMNVAFSNHNQVNVETGTLSLTGGGASTGAFSVDPNSTLKFVNGTFNLNAGTSFTGSLIQLTGGTLNVNANVTAEGFLIFGGTLTGPATFTIDGFLLWTGGVMRGTGTTQLNGEAVFSGANAKQLFDTRTFNNGGQISWEGTGNFSNVATATFNNLSGATFDIQTDADWSGGAFNNFGTVNKLAAGETLFSATFNQNGVVNIDNGTITFAGTGSCIGEFDISAGAIFNLASSNYTFNEGCELNGEGIARLTSGTLNVAADTDANNFEMINGTLTGDAEFRIRLSLAWTGGIMRGAGKTRLNGTGNISGTNAKQLSDTRTFDNAGNVIWTGTGNIIANSATAIFNNLSDGGFNIQTDADWFNGVFNNFGEFTKSVTAGETQVTAVFNSDGEVNVENGILNLRSGGNSTGIYDTSLGAIVRFSGSTHNFNAGSDFDGTGTVDFAGGTNHINTGYSYNGNTIISNGITNFNGHVILNTLTLSGGVMGGNGTVDIDGLLTWTSGIMQDNGITNANGGMNISGANPKNISHNRSLNNVGNATWTGIGNVGINPGVTFNNLSDAIFDIQTDADWLGGIFINDGTVIKSGGGDTQISSTFTNNNTVEVQAGTLSLSGNFTNFVNNTLTGGHYTVAANFRFNNADIVNNAADIELAGANSRIIDYLFTPNDALRNFAFNTESGTFHIRNGRNFSPAVPLNNAGTVIVGDQSEFSFTQQSAYTKAETGRLILRNGIFAPGNSYIQTAGLIGGVGSINISTIYRTAQEAENSPGESAGEIIINGDYIHDGRLTLELGDPDTGDYDVLHVTGHAALNGTLSILEMPGYAPQVGDSYTVLTYGSRASFFNQIEGRTLSSGLVVYRRLFDDHLDLIVSFEGDVDIDGCVDDSDLLAVLFAFGQTGNLPEDLTGDGVVDDADLLAVLFNFGSGC
jgi:hypothetical protein